FILGELLGIAHAGMKDNNHAIITASFMNPTQLRIGEYISRAPDYESEGVYLEHASVRFDEKKIILNKIKAFPHLEKELGGFERSLLNESSYCNNFRTRWSWNYNNCNKYRYGTYFNAYKNLFNCHRYRIN